VYHLVSGTAVPTLGLFARALVGSVVLQVVLLAAVQKERGIVEVLRKKAVHLGMLYNFQLGFGRP